MPRQSTMLIARLLLLLAAAACCAANAVLQHSLDGVHFDSVGRIELDAKVGSTQLTGVLHRDALSDYQVKELTTLVESGGLYTVRAALPGAAPVTTSLPAACLAQHLLEEEWRLTLDQGGGLVAMQVAVPEAAGPCTPGAGLARLAAVAQQLKAGPPPAAVDVRVPAQAPAVPRTVAGDTQLGGAAVAGAAQPQPQQQAQQRQQQQQEGEGSEGAAKNGTRGPPPEDNRTWLQKNMMFVVAGGFMVLQVVARVAQGDLPQQGGAPQGRAPARR